jgi:hypothetical protein
VDLDKLERLFKDTFQPEDKVMIVYDVIYQNAGGKFLRS